MKEYLTSNYIKWEVPLFPTSVHVSRVVYSLQVFQIQCLYFHFCNERTFLPYTILHFHTFMKALPTYSFTSNYRIVGISLRWGKICHHLSWIQMKCMTYRFIIFFLIFLLLFINCNWAYARWQCLQKGYTVNKEHSTPMLRKDDTYISYFTMKNNGARIM
jgi:hypothetical protein